MLPKILIVDDEVHIRLLLEQTLEELEDEVDVLVAEDGEQGLALIKEEKPALVFLDVMMPKRNGYDVCRIVKKELGLEDIFIVLLTAKGQEVDKNKGKEVGANIYMTKPFDPDEILERARTVLNL